MRVSVCWFENLLLLLLFPPTPTSNACPPRLTLRFTLRFRRKALLHLPDETPFRLAFFTEAGFQTTIMRGCSRKRIRQCYSLLRRPPEEITVVRKEPFSNFPLEYSLVWQLSLHCNPSRGAHHPVLILKPPRSPNSIQVNVPQYRRYNIALQCAKAHINELAQRRSCHLTHSGVGIHFSKHFTEPWMYAH